MVLHERASQKYLAPSFFFRAAAVFQCAECVSVCCAALRFCPGDSGVMGVVVVADWDTGRPRHN